jgi:hypothetical protein
MQPSPIQLHSLKFLNVNVEVRDEPNIFEPNELREPYHFEDTTFVTTISHGAAAEDPDSSVMNFFITLQIELPNSGVNPPPYIVDLKCVGYFGIDKRVSEDPIKRYDIAVVNGASILYGTLRELVSNLTSRSWVGILMLPTVNFQNDAPSLGGHVVSKTPGGKASSRKKKEPTDRK